MGIIAAIKFRPLSIAFKTCRLSFPFHPSLPSLHVWSALSYPTVNSFWWTCDSGTAGVCERFTFLGRIGCHWFPRPSCLELLWKEGREKGAGHRLSCLPSPDPSRLLLFSLGHPVEAQGHVVSRLKSCFSYAFAFPPSCSPLSHSLFLRAYCAILSNIFLLLCCYIFLPT